MTKKVTNTNGFAQDMIRLTTLTNRVHKSQVSYFTEMFGNNAQYNIDKKLKQITIWEDEKLNLYIDHKEHGVVLDNDRILQIEKDIKWYRDNIEVAETLRDYFQQASEQMFPEEHETSKQIDESIAALEAAYQAKRKSA